MINNGARVMYMYCMYICTSAIMGACDVWMRVMVALWMQWYFGGCITSW